MGGGAEQLRGYAGLIAYWLVGRESEKHYGPDWGFRLGSRSLHGRRTTLVGGFVLALAEDGEREGEQEDEDRDHDRECHPFAHPNLLSIASSWRHSIPNPSGRSTLLSLVMYNVATCSSLIR